MKYKATIRNIISNRDFLERILFQFVVLSERKLLDAIIPPIVGEAGILQASRAPTSTFFSSFKQF